MEHSNHSDTNHDNDNDNDNTPPPTPNQFLRFAYQPGTPVSVQQPLELTVSSTGKRKAAAELEVEVEVDDLSDSVHPVSSQKRKKQGTSTQSESPMGSNKVKFYHHLRGLDDHLQSGLDIIFCGINPGKKSSQIGHHYGNPTNHFWSCLYQSGLTLRILDPKEDHTLPQEFSLGLTNLVSRPTVEQRELSKSEQILGVTELMNKIKQNRPLIVCFVGLGIADIIKSVLIGKNLKSKTIIGLQPYKVVYPNGNPSETLFYAVSSTSGRVVQYQKTDKVKQFVDLRLLVEEIKKGGFDTEELTSIDTQSLENIR